MIEMIAQETAIAAPKNPLPAGACDTHAHVFGPYEQFPLADPRPYTPVPAPKEDYFAMLKAVGFDRGVLVHGGAHGWDHSAMLNAIAAKPDVLRGIGVLPGTTPESQLSELHAGGVRGLRFTEVAGPNAAQRFDGRVGFDALYELAPLMRKLRWQAVIWANAAKIASEATTLARLGLPLVIDHLGYFDVSRGVGDPAFQTLLSLVKDGVAWVKLTAFRNSKSIPMHKDVRPFQDALVEANADQLLWGSDWPFLGMKEYRPTTAALLDLLDEWLGNEQLRIKILVDNPAKLYKF